MAEMKAILINVKILMFSAYEEESYALLYIQAGADGYLNKRVVKLKLLKS